MKDKVVFLDRDGTINKEINYLYKKENFEFIPKAPEAIKLFHDLGYKVIVITNQAGVARGLYTEKDIEVLHRYIDDLLSEKDTYMDAYYYCPHHPEGIIKKYSFVCDCRKPKAGLINKVIKDYNVDLKNSLMIGDKEIDIQTGKSSGIGKNILVRSGHKIEENNTQADMIFDNIYEVANSLV